MSAFFIVKSEEHPNGMVYEVLELPEALEEFMHRVSEDEWAELRWSS
jgi:hypothetical protein